MATKEEIARAEAEAEYEWELMQQNGRSDSPAIAAAPSPPAQEKTFADENPIPDFIGRTASEIAPAVGLGALSTLFPPAALAIPSAQAGGGLLYDYAMGNLEGKDIKSEAAQRLGLYNALGILGPALATTGRGVARGAGVLARSLDDRAIGASKGLWMKELDAPFEIVTNKVGGKSIRTGFDKAKSIVEREGGFNFGMPEEAFAFGQEKIREYATALDPLIDMAEPNMARLAADASAKGVPFKIDTPRLDSVLKTLPDGTPKAVRDGYIEMVNSYRNGIEQNVDSLRGLIDEKRDLYGQINWDVRAGSVEPLKNKIYEAAALDIKDGVNKLAKETLAPDKAAEFAQLHEKLSAYYHLEPALKNAIASMRSADPTKAVLGASSAKSPLGMLIGVGSGSVAHAMGMDPVTSGLVGIGAGTAAESFARSGLGKSVTREGLGVAEQGGLMTMKIGQILANSSKYTFPIVNVGAVKVLAPRDAEALWSGGTEVPAELAQDPNFQQMILDGKGADPKIRQQMLSDFLSADKDISSKFFDSSPIPGLNVVKGEGGRYYLHDDNQKKFYADKIRREEKDVVAKAKKLNALNERDEVLLGVDKNATPTPQDGVGSEKSVEVSKDVKRQEYSY